MSRGCYCDPGTCTHMEALSQPDTDWSAITEALYQEFWQERSVPWLGFLDVEPVPKAELTVDVSRLGGDLALSPGDASVYGTSGELDPRGYWAPDVG